MPYTATHGHSLQHTATHCNTLQHFTICTPLQHIATHCNTLQNTTSCTPLQHNVTHCNTLQHTATHCNTLYTAHCNTHTRTWTLWHAPPFGGGWTKQIVFTKKKSLNCVMGWYQGSGSTISGYGEARYNVRKTRVRFTTTPLEGLLFPGSPPWLSLRESSMNPPHAVSHHTCSRYIPTSCPRRDTQNFYRGLYIAMGWHVYRRKELVAQLTVLLLCVSIVAALCVNCCCFRLRGPPRGGQSLRRSCLSRADRGHTNICMIYMSEKQRVLKKFTRHTKCVTICDVLWRIWLSHMVTLSNLWPTSKTSGFSQVFLARRKKCDQNRQ